MNVVNGAGMWEVLSVKGYELEYLKLSNLFLFTGRDGLVVL